MYSFFLLVISVTAEVVGTVVFAPTVRAQIAPSLVAGYSNPLSVSDNSDANGPTGNAMANNVIKGAGIIHGTEQDDYIKGSKGNDIIMALGGDDTVYSGSGDDTIYGGDGNNQLNGQDDNDSIVGGPLNDLVIGGPGDDRLYGNGGDDVLIGGAGVDYFDCGDGIDTIIDYNLSQSDIISNNCENVNTPY